MPKVKLREQREVIRVARNQCGLRNDLEGLQPGGVARGQEQVVETQVRVPSWKGVALLMRIEIAEAVRVASVEHDLYGLALDVAPAQPDEGAYPAGHAAHIEQLARRERVEVADQHV